MISVKIKQTIISILKKHGVLHASVFGSFVRGEETPSSDLDLLVEFPEDQSLFDHIRLCLELEEVIGRKVDVLSTRAKTHPIVQSNIEKDKIQLI